MKKRVKISFLIMLASLQAFFSFSQPDSIQIRHQVAIFTPLYLDSAFDAIDNYRYGKNFPRFINPGLEFYEGAQLAIDSLQKEGATLDIHIFDTRSTSQSIPQILKSRNFDKMDLLIGHVSANEAKLLADAAAKKKIPFINANFPIDAGVTNNPHYVILNSTLTTHCNAIYKFVQRNFSLSPIVVFMKRGRQEDLLKESFAEMERSTSSVALKVKYVNLDNNFTEEQLINYLDPQRTTACIVLSLDVNFGQKICQELSSLYETHESMIIGMPTWDVIDFTKAAYKNLEIFYSTPFYISPTDRWANSITQIFKSRFYSRPTDMVFRGYETIYHFGHLLMLHKNNISSGFSDKRYKVFTEFDIQPVLNKKTMTLDYFENKKIYFLKKVDGVVKAVY